MKIQQKPKPINGRYTSLLAPKVERDILSKISHPFIVNLCFAFQSKTKLYLVTDFIRGGELTKYIPENGLDEIKTMFIAAEVVLALEYLHKQGIIYRDLKPGNIVMDLEGHVKIIDFGISKEGMFESGRTYSKCGTPEYLAPEVNLIFGYDKSVD